MHYVLKEARRLSLRVIKVYYYDSNLPFRIGAPLRKMYCFQFSTRDGKVRRRLDLTTALATNAFEHMESAVYVAPNVTCCLFWSS